MSLIVSAVRDFRRQEKSNEVMLKLRSKDDEEVLLRSNLFFLDDLRLMRIT